MTIPFLKCVIAMLTLNALGQAADHCALKVIAWTDRGTKENSGSPVSLIDDKGRIVASTSLRDGEASICDFGFGSFSLLVGPPTRCGSVEIKNIRYLWSAEQVFHVFIHTCKGTGDGGTNGCEVLLRVRDSSGNAVPFPRVRISSGRVITGTKYGLIVTGLLWRERETFEVSASGNSAVQVELECGRDNVERYVVLTPVAAR
jgi:hypothetical protein